MFFFTGSLAESIKKEVEDTTYNEITLRRYDGVVHITLTPVSTVMKNALNISVSLVFLIVGNYVIKYNIFLFVFD